MPDQEPIVNAVGLSKIFHDFWGRAKAKAVNDIDFEVRSGEILGLLGPNGSGKSTTVKMLLGLLYPTAGRLTVFGKSPRDVAAKKRIGYLPEETYLYPYLTAFETLDFFGSLFDLSAAERRKRAEQLLDMVGLLHARDRKVGEFSKGMARRIGLAQAMINDPEFLILDEPTSGLDPIGCREVKDLILMLKKRGKTVLVTSHLLSDVEDVCDRVIILYGGKIRAEGELSDLLTDYGSDIIEVPHLGADETARVLACLRDVIGENGEIHCRNAHMSLEEFFLHVVAQAKNDSAATAGAASGGKIAEYLSVSDTSDDGARHDVLNTLLQDAAVAEDTSMPAENPEEAVEQSRNLEILLELQDDRKEEAGLSPETEMEAENKLSGEALADANDKLNGLLKGGK